MQMYFDLIALLLTFTQMNRNKTPKHTLIINGHPDKQSFCAALAEACQRGVLAAGSTPVLVHLADLHFDPVLHKAYKEKQRLEPDLQDLREHFTRCDHLILIYPLWWMNCPSLLKGMFDRLFLPGVMYRFTGNAYRREKFMRGKSARIIVTMDSPPLFYRLVMNRPADCAIGCGTLKFTGFAPLRISHFGPVRRSSPERRNRWLKKVEKFGNKMN